MAKIIREDFTFLSNDKKHNISCFSIYPEAPKAIIQIEHGIVEHKERYVAFAEEMAKRGFAVFADDHLGHGKSATKEDYGWFCEKNGWNTVCEDILTLREIATKKFPNIPFILLGHSMGSFLSRTVAINNSELVDLLVLSGTGEQSPVIVALGKMVSKIEKLRLGGKGKSKLILTMAFGPYSKPFKPNRTEYDWLSSDNSVVDNYIADDSCGGPPTIDLFYDMLCGLGYIGKKKNIKKIRKDLPIYIFSGDHDPVGNMGKGVTNIYNDYLSAGIKDVTMKLYEGGRHEMLNGPDKEKVINELCEWLDKKLEVTK